MTERDFAIIDDWLGRYRTITIEQAQHIFFNGSYESARRRLGILEKEGIIKSYRLKVSKTKAYYLNKKNIEHDILMLDYLKELVRLGCSLLDVKIRPKYLGGKLKPDMYVKFNFKGYNFITLLEYDYMHHTDERKLSGAYEELAKHAKDYKDFIHDDGNVMSFALVMARGANGLRYRATNYKAIHTNLNFDNLDRKLEFDKYR